MAARRSNSATPHPDAAELAALFDRLRDVLATGTDVDLQALLAGAPAPAIERLRANARRLRASGGSVELRNIDHNADRAAIRFLVLDRNGAISDEGVATARRFPGGWRLVDA